MTEPMIIHNIIEKETINTMPLVSFEGRIKVVDNLWDIEKAAISLEKCSIIGIDTETRPSFRKGEVHLVSLLQLATDEVSYLFRLNKVGLTPSIVRLLENPKLLKIGLSLKDDFLMLKKRASFNPEGYIELRPANPDYPVFRVEAGDNFEVWGTVIHLIRTFETV